MRDGYDVAQVCLNGHVTNKYSISFPDSNKNFCSDCGAKTIQRCVDCSNTIRGAYTGIFSTNWQAPSFCEHCGQAYPWTKTALEAAREMADEASKLTQAEKTELKNSLEDIVRDSPRTNVAVSKFKRLAAKAGLVDSLKGTIFAAASEAAKKAL